jgi:HTH-type transcriptional regulator, transcriptional repressor of NAD biosynthesis genes
MIQGFVLGKFMPLHQGHLALIRFALTKCDFLTIIVCFTRHEPIEGIIRKQWLYEELEGSKNISVQSFPYKEEELPNTSVSSREVSQQWARALKPVVPAANLVFTSEPYGEYLAEYMGIKHISFDPSRNQFPVSASAIRQDPFFYWEYIAKAAQPNYIKKIILLGSESTGKSTLTEKLAAHFSTCFVPEMAREILEKTTDCTPAHLEEIALLHARTIGQFIGQANKLLFIDTDITITESYSLFLFNTELQADDWIREANKGDLYFFLETDCPFVQDGTRLDEIERNKLSLSHKEQLRKKNIEYISIGGNWNNRLSTMIDIINKQFFPVHA